MRGFLLTYIKIYAMTRKEEIALHHLRTFALNLNCYEYNQLKPYLQILVPQLPITFHKEKTQLWRMNEDVYARNPDELYRARPNEIKSSNNLLLPFRKISDLSHIPFDKLHYVKDYGRVNLPNQAIFYSSNFYPTSCVESITNGGRFNEDNSLAVSVGTWIIKKPLILAEIGFSKNKILEVKDLNPDAYQELLNHAERQEEHFFNLMKSLSLPYSLDYGFEVTRLFLDEFAKTKISSGRDYLLSNYYADVIFNQTKINGNLIDGIIYPSIRYGYQEQNIALHPRAMYKLHFGHACNIWAVYSRNGSVEHIPLETAYSKNGQDLNWNIWQ